MRSKALTQEQKYAEYDKKAREVLVDFDGTLCQFKYPDMGPPRDGARMFMKALISRGLKPVIWSSRMSPEIYTEEERAASVEKIALWCKRYNIPHEAIDTGNCGKRLCLAYVDDRGVHAGDSWSAVLRRIDQIHSTVESRQKARRKPNEVVDRN